MGILSDENAMCDEHYRNDNCDQCPIRMAAKVKMTSCVVYKINNEEEATKMIEEWKVKHKTLISESLKKTLKGIYNLGYKTVSRKSFNGVCCVTSQGVATVFPNSLNTEFSILLPKAEYKIADLIDATFLEEIDSVIDGSTTASAILEDSLPKDNKSKEDNPDIHKFTSDMLQDGRFILVDAGEDEDWGIICNNRVIYQHGGFDVLNIKREDCVQIENILKIVETSYGFDSISTDCSKVIYERRE